MMLDPNLVSPIGIKDSYFLDEKSCWEYYDSLKDWNEDDPSNVMNFYMSNSRVAVYATPIGVAFVTCKKIDKTMEELLSDG